MKGPCSYFARETLSSSIKGQEIKLKGSSSVIKDGLWKQLIAWYLYDVFDEIIFYFLI